MRRPRSDGAWICAGAQTGERTAANNAAELAVRWMLAERPPGPQKPTKYWLADLPDDAPLRQLVGLAKIRWRIEHHYRETQRHARPRPLRGSQLTPAGTTTSPSLPSRNAFLTLERNWRPQARGQPDPVRSPARSPTASRLLEGTCPTCKRKLRPATTYRKEAARLTRMFRTARVQKLDSYTSARTDVTAMLPHVPRRLLDIGCSDGSLARTIKDQGAEAWGIELDAQFAATAAARLDTVLQGDALVRTAELVQAGERFDAIICADSLEHMVDPWAVLRNVRKLVDDNGVVIVSLPNVHFYTTFVWLLFRRRWRYRELGIHDRTHLRWFTDLNARDMFAETGFHIEDCVTYYRLVDQPAPKRNRLAPHLAIGPLKSFLAYQYLYRLR